VEYIVSPNAFYQKIRDEDRETLRHMFETNVLYLPSEFPPEKLFFEKLNNSETYRESFKDEFDVQDEMIQFIVNQLASMDNHQQRTYSESNCFYF